MKKTNQHSRSREVNIAPPGHAAAATSRRRNHESAAAAGVSSSVDRYSLRGKHSANVDAVENPPKRSRRGTAEIPVVAATSASAPMEDFNFDELFATLSASGKVAAGPSKPPPPPPPPPPPSLMTPIHSHPDPRPVTVDEHITTATTTSTHIPLNGQFQSETTANLRELSHDKAQQPAPLELTETTVVLDVLTEIGMQVQVPDQHRRHTAALIPRDFSLLLLPQPPLLCATDGDSSDGNGAAHGVVATLAVDIGDDVSLSRLAAPLSTEGSHDIRPDAVIEARYHRRPEVGQVEITADAESWLVRDALVEGSPLQPRRSVFAPEAASMLADADTEDERDEWRSAQAIPGFTLLGTSQAHESDYGRSRRAPSSQSSSADEAVKWIRKHGQHVASSSKHKRPSDHSRSRHGQKEVEVNAASTAISAAVAANSSVPRRASPTTTPQPLMPAEPPFRNSATRQPVRKEPDFASFYAASADAYGLQPARAAAIAAVAGGFDVREQTAARAPPAGPFAWATERESATAVRTSAVHTNAGAGSSSFDWDDGAGVERRTQPAAVAGFGASGHTAGSTEGSAASASLGRSAEFAVPAPRPASRAPSEGTVHAHGHAGGGGGGGALWTGPQVGYGVGAYVSAVGRHSQRVELYADGGRWLRLPQTCARCGVLFTEAESAGRWECFAHRYARQISASAGYACCGMVDARTATPLWRVCASRNGEQPFRVGCIPVDHITSDELASLRMSTSTVAITESQPTPILALTQTTPPFVLQPGAIVTPPTLPHSASIVYVRKRIIPP